MKVTVSISYNMKKNLWIFRSHLSAAQHPTLKARPLQWRSSARFPHCRWTQPSNAVDPPARAQCSDPRNHWNHLSSDESVVFFSLGVQNISKIFARINTHGHLWLLTHFTNCRIKLSIEWNQTFQLRSIPIIVFYFFSVFFSIHLSDTDQYITFQYIEYHKPHSSQLLSFCWITNSLPGSHQIFTKASLACGSVVDFTQVLRLKHRIRKAIGRIKGPTAAWSFLRIIQQPEAQATGRTAWKLGAYYLDVPLEVRING